MTAWLWLMVFVAAVAGGIAAGLFVRRKWTTARRRRAKALADVARRVDAAIGSLEAPASGSAGVRSAPAEVAFAPAIDGTSGGRAALVDRAVEQVAAARTEGTRLAAAVVRTAPGTPVGAIAPLAGVPVYVVGPDAFAILLPGLGRADALGVVARIEAHVAVSGRAVELEPGESAAELVTRLLGSAPAGG